MDLSKYFNAINSISFDSLRSVLKKPDADKNRGTITLRPRTVTEQVENFRLELIKRRRQYSGIVPKRESTLL